MAADNIDAYIDQIVFPSGERVAQYRPMSSGPSYTEHITKLPLDGWYPGDSLTFRNLDDARAVVKKKLEDDAAARAQTDAQSSPCASHHASMCGMTYRHLPQCAPIDQRDYASWLDADARKQPNAWLRLLNPLWRTLMYHTDNHRDCRSLLRACAHPSAPYRIDEHTLRYMTNSTHDAIADQQRRAYVPQHACTSHDYWTVGPYAGFWEYVFQTYMENPIDLYRMAHTCRTMYTIIGTKTDAPDPGPFKSCYETRETWYHGRSYRKRLQWFDFDIAANKQGDDRYVHYRPYDAATMARSPALFVQEISTFTIARTGDVTTSRAWNPSLESAIHPANYWKPSPVYPMFSNAAVAAIHSKPEECLDSRCCVDTAMPMHVKQHPLVHMTLLFLKSAHERIVLKNARRSKRIKRAIKDYATTMDSMKTHSAPQEGNEANADLIDRQKLLNLEREMAKLIYEDTKLTKHCASLARPCVALAATRFMLHPFVHDVDRLASSKPSYTGADLLWCMQTAHDHMREAHKYQYARKQRDGWEMLHLSKAFTSTRQALQTNHAAQQNVDLQIAAIRDNMQRREEFEQHVRHEVKRRRAAAMVQHEQHMQEDHCRGGDKEPNPAGQSPRELHTRSLSDVYTHRGQGRIARTYDQVVAASTAHGGATPPPAPAKRQRTTKPRVKKEPFFLC